MTHHLAIPWMDGGGDKMEKKGSLKPGLDKTRFYFKILPPGPPYPPDTLKLGLNQGLKLALNGAGFLRFFIHFFSLLFFKFFRGSPSMDFGKLKIP